MNTLSPSFEVAFTSAPAFKRTEQASSWPPWTAQISAVKQYWGLTVKNSLLYKSTYTENTETDSSGKIAL